MEELSATNGAIEKTISNISRKAPTIGGGAAPVSHPSHQNRSSAEQHSLDGELEKHETQHDAPARGSRKEELSRIESEAVYPKGVAVALIMLSLYLAIFLIALVWNLPIMNIQQKLITGSGPDNYRHRYPVHHKPV